MISVVRRFIHSTCSISIITITLFAELAFLGAGMVRIHMCTAWLLAL